MHLCDWNTVCCKIWLHCNLFESQYLLGEDFADTIFFMDRKAHISLIFTFLGVISVVTFFATLIADDFSSSVALVLHITSCGCQLVYISLFLNIQMVGMIRSMWNAWFTIACKSRNGIGNLPWTLSAALTEMKLLKIDVIDAFMFAVSATLIFGDVGFCFCHLHVKSRQTESFWTKHRPAQL